MSGWSFDPRPSNGGHHPNSKDCPLFFPPLLFGDSFSQLHHLCVFGHKSCKASFCCFALQQNVQLTAMKVHCWIRHLKNDTQTGLGMLVGAVLPRGKPVRQYPKKVHLQEIPLSISYTTVIPSIKTLFHADSFILLSRSVGERADPPIFSAALSECGLAVFLRRQRWGIGRGEQKNELGPSHTRKEIAK